MKRANKQSVNRKTIYIWIMCAISALVCGCKNDTTRTGWGMLDPDDSIIVLADTFPVTSGIDSCEAIISQPDSFLLGEMETDYGLLRASILTQLACPEGYVYPTGAEVDSICLFMYYSSWVGDGSAPIAINAYMLDKNTFTYSGTYPTDLNIDDYCTRDHSILVNRRIVAAQEKMDSLRNDDGTYTPMLRMRLNDDFMNYFWAIRSFEDQVSFNNKFKGLLLETSFGSSTILNVTDVALGVFYHFSYSKAGRDTTVNDMKAFYANSEVRTVNHIHYRDKAEWVESMKKDSDSYNYIVAPAGIYTRMCFPMARIVDSMQLKLAIDTLPDGEVRYKRPYVNLAQVRVDVENVFAGSSTEKVRNDWLQPASHMLMVNEKSMNRFFRDKELPSDTCALLSALTQGKDSAGNAIYYYTYDLSDLLTRQLRQDSLDSELNMILVPVSVSTGTTGAITAVRQQQTVSATKIRSAKNGVNLKLVYSGF